MGTRLRGKGMERDSERRGDMGNKVWEREGGMGMREGKDRYGNVIFHSALLETS